MNTVGVATGINRNVPSLQCQLAYRLIDVNRVANHNLALSVELLRCGAGRLNAGRNARVDVGRRRGYPKVVVLAERLALNRYGGIQEIEHILFSMITLVTTTRNRSLSFSLLEHWISRQTVQPNQWLVINDGTDPYSYNHKQQVVLRDPGKDVLPSICENWLAALPLIRGDVVVAEDDDWLHPEYLATMRELLEAADLVGFTDGTTF